MIHSSRATPSFAKRVPRDEVSPPRNVCRASVSPMFHVGQFHHVFQVPIISAYPRNPGTNQPAYPRYPGINQPAIHVTKVSPNQHTHVAQVSINQHTDVLFVYRRCLLIQKPSGGECSQSLCWNFEQTMRKTRLNTDIKQQTAHFCVAKHIEHRLHSFDR